LTRLLVAGGRDFSDYALLCTTLDKFIECARGPIEFVSGGAKGADALGERFAAERGYPITVMKAEWKKYGKAAGVIRNKQMLDYIWLEDPAVIAFWDGSSHGTKHTIDTAIKMGISPKVVRY